MGQGTLGEVRDGSCYPLAGPGRVMDPAKGPGRVGGHSGRSRTCRFTLGEVRDGSGDPPGCPGRGGGPRRGSGRVLLPSCISRMGHGPSQSAGPGRGTLGDLRDRSGKSRMGWGPSGRSGTGRGTLGEVRDGSGDTRGIKDVSVYPRRSLGRVGEPSERSGTGHGTLREFRDA